MKKHYINPSIYVISIATQKMLAASTESIDTGSYTGGEVFSRESDYDYEEGF